MLITAYLLMLTFYEKAVGEFKKDQTLWREGY
jgi:hypothetical protein